MNYEKNKIDWKVGDIVIHDADAKKEHMLMKVTKILSDGSGLIQTELIDKYMGRNPEYHKPLSKKNRTFNNHKMFLHDPKRFGIDTSKI